MGADSLVGLNSSSTTAPSNVVGVNVNSFLAAGADAVEELALALALALELASVGVAAESASVFWKRTTMHERLSVLKRLRAWSTSILAAVVASAVLRIRSTAS